MLSTNSRQREREPTKTPKVRRQASTVSRATAEGPLPLPQDSFAQASSSIPCQRGHSRQGGDYRDYRRCGCLYTHLAFSRVICGTVKVGFSRPHSRGTRKPPRATINTHTYFYTSMYERIFRHAVHIPSFSLSPSLSPCFAPASTAPPSPSSSSAASSVAGGSGAAPVGATGGGERSPALSPGRRRKRGSALSSDPSSPAAAAAPAPAVRGHKTVKLKPQVFRVPTLGHLW